MMGWVERRMLQCDGMGRRMLQCDGVGGEEDAGE